MNSRRFVVSTASVLLVLGLTSCGDDKKGKRSLHGDGGGSATADDDTNDEESGEGSDHGDGGGDSQGGHASGPTIELLDAGPRCDVTHSELGCGVTKGEWVAFDNGLRVDRRTGFAWVDVPLEKEAGGRPPETDDALEQKCRALRIPGVPGFRIPEMKDVRTLAAGCAKTLPTGPCKIESGRTPAVQGADCACAGGPAQGPHPSGGFCRPELSECETVWTATFCGNHSEGCVGDADHKHWFYDVKTGAIVVSGYETEIARTAKGRCVSTAQVELP